MANALHLEILAEEGVPAWNAWRLDHGNLAPDLQNASFSQAKFAGTKLPESVRA